MCCLHQNIHHRQSNPSPVKRPQEWHIKWIHSSAFFQCRLKLKSRIFLRTSEKPSERHGTCTHSPSLSPSFERMTATSQRVKNLKPYLAAHCWFFFLFSLSGGTRGSYRHHRIHFISLAASALSVVILWRLSMTPPPPTRPPDTLLLFSI